MRSLKPWARFLRAGRFAAACVALACSTENVGPPEASVGVGASEISLADSEPERLAFQIRLELNGQWVPLLLELQKTPPPIALGYETMRYGAQGLVRTPPQRPPTCLYSGELYAVSSAVPAEFLEAAGASAPRPSLEAPVRIRRSFASVSSCVNGGVSIDRAAVKGWVSAFGKVWHLELAATQAAQARYRLLEVSGVKRQLSTDLVRTRYTGLVRVQPKLRLLSEPRAIREGTPNETKYIQVLAFNDQARVVSAGANVEADTIATVHMVNALFAGSGLTPRTRVVLSGQVSFDDDPYAAERVGVETEHEDLLTKFSDWGATAELPAHDLRILMSGLDFVGSVVGLAPLGAACRHEVSALIAETGVPRSTPVIVAHEIGHTLGMQHDGEANNCAERGFIMAAATCSNCNDKIELFSECSQGYYTEFLASSSYRLDGSCLDDLPELVVAPSCGDGVVSAGEQCDCGSSDCADLDPCCDGATCQLNAGAVCSDYSDLCCQGCRIATAADNKVCREAQSECDSAETCVGLSKECPGDSFSAAGEACKDNLGNEGACFLGQCQTLAASCTAVGEILGEELGPPSSQCPWSCGEAACESSSLGCVVISDWTPPDGISCGNGMQCLQGECTANLDQCPEDENKRDPGTCGCGTADVDADTDGTPDCLDQCPADAAKVLAGSCGCGLPDTDTDNDTVLDCDDACAEDPNKTSPGECGCGQQEVAFDSDNDGAPDCRDECPDDPLKSAALACGCGARETDSDNDGTPDCVDECKRDPNKLTPGQCGCDVSEVDTDGDGVPECGKLACPPSQRCTEEGERENAVEASCACDLGDAEQRLGSGSGAWLLVVFGGLLVRRRRFGRESSPETVVR